VVRRITVSGKVMKYLFTATLALAVLAGTVRPVEASNDALLRLLQTLRDKGAITAAEYEEIRKVVASTPDPVTPEARVAAVEQRVAAQEKALAGKWYEKIGLRGYGQVRFSNVTSSEGAVLEVPNDRSVNEPESLMIRRGRMVFSGDATEHLSVYTQFDLNGSTGAADFSLQMRDLYADVWFDKAKTWRVRVGQSKVPFGWVNLQSSQNRAALERPDALNSAVEGERDLGTSLMWTSPVAKQRFRDLTGLGLKGSGDYGVVAIGAYGGQGLNRSDVNGNVHWVGRLAYPFKLASGQFFELGVQGYRGRFVSPVQAVTVGGTAVTPAQRADGVLDQRAAVTAIWYPQPFGVEAEWTVGRGPTLSADSQSIGADTVQGGYIQVNFRTQNRAGTWFPFSRWNYFDGARKFARNAPVTKVNEVDFGLEFAKWAEVELTAMYTRTITRTRTSTFPYGSARDANRFGIQVQWNH
jgi:Phosphate-selective porin O and P